MTVSTLISILQKLDSPDLEIEMEDDNAQLAVLVGVRIDYSAAGIPESVILR